MIKAALSGEPIEILDHLVGILGPRNARDNCLAAISPEVIDTPLGAKKLYVGWAIARLPPIQWNTSAACSAFEPPAGCPK